MSADGFPCARQERCPVVMAACERKVRAEGAARLAQARLDELAAEYDRKKPVMNELYAAGVAMRRAQKTYFTNRTQPALYAAKEAEARFDNALDACRNLGREGGPVVAEKGGDK